MRAGKGAAWDGQTDDRAGQGAGLSLGWTSTCSLAPPPPLCSASLEGQQGSRAAGRAGRPLGCASSSSSELLPGFECLPWDLRAGCEVALGPALCRAPSPPLPPFIC